MQRLRCALALAACRCALGARRRLGRPEHAVALVAGDSKALHKVANYASRADIPSGCELAPANKVANDGRCLFDDQCQSGFCCPYCRCCQGQEVGSWTADTLLRQILVAPPQGEGTNACENGFCLACDYRDAAQSGSTAVNPCLTWSTNPDGSNAQPILTTSSQSMIDFAGLWNLADPACNCDARFIQYMLDDCWVPECHGASQSNPLADQLCVPTATPHGFVQMGHNCNCGGTAANQWAGAIANFPQGKGTPDACAAECRSNSSCASFALWAGDSAYPGHCRLFDTACQDVDGHTQGQTGCASPTPASISLTSYNKVTALLLQLPAPAA
jgi:hypothetical protein